MAARRQPEGRAALVTPALQPRPRPCELREEGGRWAAEPGRPGATRGSRTVSSPPPGGRPGVPGTGRPSAASAAKPPMGLRPPRRARPERRWPDPRRGVSASSPDQALKERPGFFSNGSHLIARVARGAPPQLTSVQLASLEPTAWPEGPGDRAHHRREGLPCSSPQSWQLPASERDSIRIIEEMCKNNQKRKKRNSESPTVGWDKSNTMGGGCVL